MEKTFLKIVIYGRKKKVMYVTSNIKGIGLDIGLKRGNDRIPLRAIRRIGKNVSSRDTIIL